MMNAREMKDEIIGMICRITELIDETEIYSVEKLLREAQYSLSQATEKLAVYEAGKGA